MARRWRFGRRTSGTQIFSCRSPQTTTKKTSCGSSRPCALQRLTSFQALSCLPSTLVRSCLANLSLQMAPSALTICGAISVWTRQVSAGWCLPSLMTTSTFCLSMNSRVVPTSREFSIRCRHSSLKSRNRLKAST